MQELDDVFSRSNNSDVSNLLRQMQDRVQSDLLKLQEEYKILKNLKDLPSDLLAVIKQGELLKPKSKK